MKPTKARISLLLILIVVATVTAVGLRFHRERQTREVPPPAQDTTPPGASMALANVRQTAVKNGIKEWHLEAAAATLLEAEHKMMLDQPHVVFYLKSGDVVALTAQKGVLDTESKDIQVSGQVVVRDRDYTLTGEAFAYSNDQHRLISQAPVEIHSKDVNLTAKHMMVDLKTHRTELAGNVKGIFNDAISL
ncbi:MAG: LPS export ABC transporter periplasmic protein LptC [Desulfosarcinaceae bacterium]|jgi:LPS export ABC transporter protein LptC